MQWKKIISDKMYTDRDGLSAQIEKWKLFNEQVVFTNGCFDILHLGHLDYLSKAADIGDRLVIGLNSDRSVRKLKGDTRPVIDEYTRAFKLASLAFVDAVVIFEEDTPAELIKALKPDILVKGGDYSADKVVGADTVIASGGRVEIIPFLKGHSTSAIIETIRRIDHKMD